MTALVRDLFHKIESLSDEDRLALDRLLARKMEAEWQAGAKKARALAKKRKVSLADINAYIERRRYGA